MQLQFYRRCNAQSTPTLDMISYVVSPVVEAEAMLHLRVNLIDELL